MTKDHRGLNSQPTIMALGSHFTGATLRGSFQVFGANECRRHYAYQ